MVTKLISNLNTKSMVNFEIEQSKVVELNQDEFKQTDFQSIKNARDFMIKHEKKLSKLNIPLNEIESNEKKIYYNSSNILQISFGDVVKSKLSIKIPFPKDKIKSINMIFNQELPYQMNEFDFTNNQFTLFKRNFDKKVLSNIRNLKMVGSWLSFNNGVLKILINGGIPFDKNDYKVEERLL